MQFSKITFALGLNNIEIINYDFKTRSKADRLFVFYFQGRLCYMESTQVVNGAATVFDVPIETRRYPIRSAFG